jgi:hypothetical protein
MVEVDTILRPRYTEANEAVQCKGGVAGTPGANNTRWASGKTHDIRPITTANVPYESLARVTIWST